MKNRILAPLGLAALLTASLPAATYDYDDPSTNRSLRLYVPDGQDTIRGILLNGNGAGGDSTAEADAPLKQAWVDKHGFAILATGTFGRFQDGTSGDDWRVLTEGLAALAADSGHGELSNAPFLCWGYSNGGQMAYGLARLLGDRVIAFIVNKGGFYIGAPHGTDPYNIPALFFSGEADKDYRRDAIEGLYQDGRDNNARWAWIEEYKTGHGVRNSESMAFAFFEQVLPLRYPEDANNLPTPDAAPSLTSLPLDSG